MRCQEFPPHTQYITGCIKAQELGWLFTVLATSRCSCLSILFYFLFFIFYEVWHINLKTGEYEIIAKMPEMEGLPSGYFVLMVEIEYDIGADLDCVVDICARPREYSFSNQYEIQNNYF